MKRKVLFVIPELSHGGSNKCLENIISLLSEDKYIIRIVSLGIKESDSPYANTFSRYLLSLSLLYKITTEWTFIRKVLNALHNYLHLEPWLLIYKIESYILQKKYNFDIVVGFQESYPTHFASYFNTRKIAWVHCDYDDYKLRSNNLDETRWYEKFDNIVCVSNYTAKTFSMAYPLLKDKVQTIYNPLNTQEVECKSKCHIENGLFLNSSFNIVSIGRFVEVKQFHMIPQIVCEVVKKGINKNIIWYIIGDGDQFLVEETKKRIECLGVETNIILLGSKENPYPYIANSDLLVCTSRSEACPYVVNEAKILHIPVLSTDYPSASELINSDNGIIDTIDKLSLHIVNLVNDYDGCYSIIKAKCNNTTYNNVDIMSRIQTILG